MAPSLWPLYLLDTHRHMSIASLHPKRYTLCAKQVAAHSPWTRLCEMGSPCPLRIHRALESGRWQSTVQQLRWAILPVALPVVADQGATPEARQVIDDYCWWPVDRRPPAGTCMLNTSYSNNHLQSTAQARGKLTWPI